MDDSIHCIINWFNVVSLRLGATLVQFIVFQMAPGHFTVLGFSQYLQHLITNNIAPAFWNTMLLFAIQHVKFLTPIQMIVYPIIAILFIYPTAVHTSTVGAALLCGILAFSKLGVSALKVQHTRNYLLNIQNLC